MLYFLSATVHVLLGALELCMFARAILSWFPPEEESRLELFLFSVTEPLIVPVRAVLNRFESIAALPIDISFFVTMLLLSFLQILL